MKEVKKNNFDPLKISKGSNIVLNIVLILLTISAILPFLFVVMISFTDEDIIRRNGYQLIPEKFSTEAYQYVFKGGGQIATAYKNSVIIINLHTCFLCCFFEITLFMIF